MTIQIARAIAGNGTPSLRIRGPGRGQPSRIRQDSRAGIARAAREGGQQMITGMHSIIYASDAPAARAFLRDVLGLPFVDAHDGWLIFKQPPSELAVQQIVYDTIAMVIIGIAIAALNRDKRA